MHPKDFDSSASLVRDLDRGQATRPTAPLIRVAAARRRPCLQSAGFIIADFASLHGPRPRRC